MKNRKQIILYFIIFFGSFRVSAQSPSPNKVLFIGNSYTYFWNLPQQVAALAEHQDISLQTRQSTSGGSNLGQHWKGEKNLSSLDLIREGNYDAIILQDHSMRALEQPDSLMYYGQLFGQEIQAKQARIYLYMTWARAYDPYMQATITNKYTELAEKINAQIVPVGLAWQRARSLRPDLALYDKDQSHPSPLGSYLSACVFYSVLTGKSPVGLPHRITSQDQNGEKLYLNIQSKEDALFCQKVAQEIIQRQTD